MKRTRSILGRLVAATVAAAIVQLCPTTGAGAEIDPGVLDSLHQISGVASDPLYRDLVTACEQNRIDEALGLLQRLQAKTAFRIAADACEQNRFKEAVDGFSLAASLDPSNDRARLELGRALAAQGRTEEARRQYESVLERRPPEAVAQNIRKAMASLQRVPQRGSWSASVEVGGMYDDNVNLGPDPTVVRVAPIAFGTATIDELTVAEDSRPKDAYALYTLLTLAGRQSVGEAGLWSAQGGASYYDTWFDQNQDYEIRYARIYGGMARGASGSLADFPVRYEHIDRGNDSLVDIYGFTPSYTLGRGGIWYGISTATAEYRDYADFNAGDAMYYELDQAVLRTVGRSRHMVQMGVAGFREEADAAEFTNSGLELRLGGEAKLGWQALAYLRLRYRGAWYDEREELAPADRQDDQWQASIGCDKRINARWSMSAGYQWTRNGSTFSLYDYERNIATLSTAAHF